MGFENIEKREKKKNLYWNVTLKKQKKMEINKWN